MNSRSLLVAFAWMLICAVANAQSTVMAPNTVMAPTGVMAPAGITDPYAMTPTSTNPYLWGNGFSIPTSGTSCIRDRFWFSVDYLYWWTEGMGSVPLVTTSTNPADEGILGTSSTSVLYGGDSLNGGSSNGGRLRTGWWFRQGAWSLETEFFRFKTGSDTFASSSDGDPLLARPFVNIVTGSQSSRVIASSLFGSPTGSVAVFSNTRLESGLINGRISLIPLGMLGCNDGCDPPDRVDWIVGYRALRLKDNLGIADQRESLVVGGTESVSTADAFSTKNSFSGLQLGVIYQTHFRRAWMESMIRVAIGNNRQTTSILGGTNVASPGGSASYSGGLLAQRSNIGTYENKEFTMIPELGLNFGFRVTQCLHATVGYNLLYFPNVVRASEQIDPDVNPGLIPPEAALLTGAFRPVHRSIESDYWAHGLNFGAALRF